jgi:hypothetical protein
VEVTGTANQTDNCARLRKKKREKAVFISRFIYSICRIMWAREEYPHDPDSQRKPGMPDGTVTKYTWNNKVFPGTVRDYWVYVPAQYPPDKPACVMLFKDGGGGLNDGPLRVPIVFDNLISKRGGRRILPSSAVLNMTTSTDQLISNDERPQRNSSRSRIPLRYPLRQPASI